MTPVLRASGLEKIFRVRPDGSRSLKRDVLDTLGNNRRIEPDGWVALRDASFEIQPRESVGIVGPNGAGKSTLLKLIAGVYEPSGGALEVNGSVTALLELGAGFQSDLNGRENIFLNASLYGHSNADIARRVPAIEAFSELGEWLDVPLKHYSTGMATRLAFSIAAHLDHEILLLDEIFAVGDLAFQKKSMEKIRSLRGAGTTILFASHQPAHIEILCDRAMYLKAGRVESMGPAADVVRQYVDDSA